MGQVLHGCATTPHAVRAAIQRSKARHTLLALDDCLYALQATILHLTRSSLHRLFQRHDISRLPTLEGDKTGRKSFKVHPVGYFHIDIAEVRTEEGKRQRLVAIDFLRRLIEAVLYKVHTVLTDNGTHFTTPGTPVRPPRTSAPP